MALSTINRFLNGKPVDFATFVEICDRLNLDWQTITNITGDDTTVTTSSDQVFPAQSIAEATPAETGSDTPRQDWGEAIDTTFFHGRQDELAQLQTAILTDKCRLVAILGIGGIGKTSLAAKLARTIYSEFDAVIWRSVRNAPPLKNLLQDLVPFLSYQQDIEPTLDRLFHWLRNHRCLVILDNIETLLESGQSGQYRTGYKDYGTLLRQFGETAHHSCLIITSREKTSEIGLLESDQLFTRSFQLNGSAEAAQAIVQAKGLLGEQKTIKQFCQRYGDNPLVVKIVGTSIQSIFDSDINLFLQENSPVFNDFRRLLNQQFERLSSLEKSILYWLAINREWTNTSELINDIWPMVPRSDVFEALESLSWRSLIETKAGQYTQQPVIMEYVTDRLIQTIYQELEILHQERDFSSSFPLLICTHALLKTTTKNHIRDSQRRMILSFLAQRLQTTLAQPKIVGQYMTSISKSLEQVVAGYGIGNFINLCCQLQIDLTGYDFSDLAIWQADLHEITLQNTNFARSNFKDCQFNHQFGGITSLALNPDDTLLAASDLQGNIHIWQTDTYQQLGTISGHTGAVFSVAFSPKGDYLLSGSSDTTLKLWRMSDYQCVATFEGHRHMVMSVAFTPGGGQIASASFGQSIKLWDIASEKCLQTFEGHTSTVRSLSFAKTDNILASASFDNTIKLWDWQKGQCITTLNGHTQGVWAVDFGPNDRVLVSGSDDQTVRVWDPKTGQCLKVLSGHQHAVWLAKVSPDGTQIASGDYSGLIRLWDLDSGLCERLLYGHASWLWSSMTFSKTGQILYSGSHDRTIRTWDIQSGYCLKTLSGYTNTVWSLAFSPDGNTLVSGSHDGKVRLWDINHRQLTSVLHHNSPIFDVSFSRNGEYLASGGSGEQAVIKVWCLDNGSLHQKLSGHSSVIRSVRFHPTNTLLLASASDDQTIKFWAITDNNHTKKLSGHTNAIWSVTFSQDAKYLATGSFDCSVKLWNIETGDCVHTLTGHSDNIFSVVFSPDDRLIASTSADATIKLWSMPTGRCLKTLTGHSNGVLIGLFSPDSSKFVSGEFNGSIKIWDVDSGQCIQTLQAHNHILWALAFSPDGKVLASGGEGDTIKLWNTQLWQCFGTLRLPGPYEGMNLTNATGLSAAEKTSLCALGAFST